jgi:hypothetical protein
LLPTGRLPVTGKTVQQSGGSKDSLENRNLPTLETASTNRKDFLVAATITATSFLSNPFTSAAEDSTIPEKTNLPICIIGANGKTGSECVKACLDRSFPLIATSRTGVYSGPYGQDRPNLMSVLTCDVTNPSTINDAIRGSRAVIFAASASKQGGTASAVDNQGLVNVAKACLSEKIPHLVIVSSGGVSKPDSAIYKFLNLFGNIMEEKIKGEDTVRFLFKNSDSSTYTIIRPGGLTEEPGLGVAALELNQGDVKSGRIARADVASLCVESILYPDKTGKTTFECYNADTGKPLSSVGMSNIMKATNKESDSSVMSGSERRGNSWGQIFTGLEKDS